MPNLSTYIFQTVDGNISNFARRNLSTSSGFSRRADVSSRSIRIRNLPPGTQEGLLQQTLEKIAAVKRVEVFADQQEADVELENAAVGLPLLAR